MTNKIVILKDSVVLYEHYFDDTRWERTLAFPFGGLTYLISNSTIKFYAFEDYLYRNCLLSMSLPIYIYDEAKGIDGEYSDIDEITTILDRIFPSTDIEKELDDYLRIVDAENTYQPIGDYVLKSDIPDMDDYVTDEELVEALDDYYTKDETSTKTEISDALNLKQDKLIAGANITISSGNVISASGGGGEPVDAYTKEESNARFQPKGDYVTESNLSSYISNLQQQINSLIQAVSGCCSETGETIYRWITLTDDYICEGTTKYEKQQKQQSEDNGITWTNVVPAEYQKGNILETDSVDCGYSPYGEKLIMTDTTGGTYTLYCEEGTNYLTVHGMKNFTYYDGTTKTNISGFLPDSTLQSITDVELGECLESVGSQVFMNYSGLTTVTISNNIKSLGGSCFEGCTSLETIIIPDSVYYISGRAFERCSNLSSVTIGSGIEEIVDYAFCNCTNLSTFIINSTTPPILGDYVFLYTSESLKIYVPDESVNTYKTSTNWENIADKIYPLSELNLNS